MNLKQYFPYERYTLTTRLGVEEVRRRIADNIEPKRVFRFPFFGKKQVKPYEGQLTADLFIISRIINYRNSFLPVITGRISSFLGQTEVRITMRPIGGVIIFMTFWLGFVGMGCIATLVALIWPGGYSDEKNLILLFLVFLAMFLFGYSLMFFAFKGESKKSKAFLAELLEGKGG